MSNIRPFSGMSPDIDPSAWIDPSAVVIGDVVIGPDSSIWPMAVVRGDIHRIRIGRATNIQDGAVLHVTHPSRFVAEGHPLLIGDLVTVGHQAVLHGCEIRDRCLIGIGARVLDGALLESGTLVGAGALVPPGRHLEGGYLWVGAPVRKARALNERELEYLDYVAQHYIALAERYRAE
jgi:carbonic anhydrase/acetyltransferase-like protein (isoleucine patch superfamily)